MNDGNPIIPKTGNDGVAVFNAILAIVRNRTGLNYNAGFNKVLADNADLMRPSIDATEHTAPFLKLLNRTQSATGLSAMASINRAEEKIAKVTNRFFPSLRGAPTCLQWDVLERTALLLEKCGIANRIYDRTGNAEASESDRTEANDQAEDVYSKLNAEATQPVDRGPKLMMQLPPKHIGAAFRSAIRMLMENDKELTLRQAFDQLKEREPIFWVHSILNFNPGR
jgi:hypothetical protein